MTSTVWPSPPRSTPPRTDSAAGPSMELWLASTEDVPPRPAPRPPAGRRRPGGRPAPGRLRRHRRRRRSPRSRRWRRPAGRRLRSGNRRHRETPSRMWMSWTGRESPTRRRSSTRWTTMARVSSWRSRASTSAPPTPGRRRRRPPPRRRGPWPAPLSVEGWAWSWCPPATSWCRITPGGDGVAAATVAQHARRVRPGGEPVQAPGLRVPLGRDLRGLPLHLRLRPRRRAGPAQREAGLVALDGPAARRRGGHRRRHLVPAGHLGGLGPPAQLHRPPGRLPRVPGALPPGPARGPVALSPVRRPRQLHRGPPVQPHVQDPRRPRGERQCRGLPAARDRPGHVRQLQERAGDVAQEAPVRHRPGGQVVPQRDHPGQLHLPHPGVRADGDGVLRGARRGAEVVRLLVRGALPLVPRPGHPR